jgi:hypothetical protein
MAAITSAATGLWSATGTWVGGVVPGEFDTVTIAVGHTVTVDGTYIVGNDVVGGLVINGRLKASRTVNSLLTLKTTIANATTGEFDWGIEGDIIPAGVTAGIRINYSAVMANNKYDIRLGTTNRFNLIGMRGANKRRHTKTTTAVVGGTTLTFTVDDATGWAVNDWIIISADQNSVSTQVEAKQISAISGNDITVATAWTNNRAAGAVVANVWSNVYIEHFNAANFAVFSISPRTGMPANSIDIKNVSVHGGGTTGDQSAFGIWNATYFANSTAVFRDGVVERCAATNLRRDGTLPTITSGAGQGFGMAFAAIEFEFLECVVAVRANTTFGSAYRTASNAIGVGFRSCCSLNVHQSFLANFSEGGQGIQINDMVVRNATIVSVVSPGNAITWNNGDLDRYDRFAAPGAGSIIVNGTNFGTNNPGFIGSTLSTSLALQTCVINNSTVGTMQLFGSIFTTGPANPLAEFSFVNKNSDVTLQEIQTARGFIARDNAVSKRSTSSVRFQPQRANVAHGRTYLLAGASAGQAVTVRGSLRFDTTYGTATPPSVTLSGQGSTPATFTAPATANAWHDFSLTVTPTLTGDLSLAVTGTSAATTGNYYFDGVVIAPFIVAARHYGFLYNNAVFQTVDPVITVSNETTVGAYTGIAINHGTQTVTLTVSRSFAEFYDYSQWNLGQTANLTVPVYLSGTLANLSSAYNIVVDGVAFTGAGNNLTLGTGRSISFINGGSCTARLSGAVVFNAPATITQAFGTATITFTAGGTYDLRGNSITGTLTFVNTSGSPVTVRIDPGVSFVNSGPSLTVDNSPPPVYQSVTVTNGVAGSRLLIQDITTPASPVTLYAGVPASYPHTWTDAVAYVADRDIRVRAAYQSGASAKLFVDEAVGTVTLTSPALSYRLNQQDDTVYQANAIDGSTVTGITIDDPTMLINVSTSTISLPSIYAYETYWLATAAGIIDEGRIINATDTANYVFRGGWKIKNTSSPSAPLTITGGYMVDAATGTAISLIDTTGGTIFLAPMHVVPYATGSGVTAQDKLDIAAATLTAAQTAPIQADIRKVNGYTVDGQGTDSDPWGPV